MLGPPSSTTKRVETPAVFCATRLSSMTLGRFSGRSASKPVSILSLSAKKTATAVRIAATTRGIAGRFTCKSAIL